jgi:hypothetical protein
MLQIARAITGGGYPLNSGHSAIRDPNSASFNREQSRTQAQLRQIACLGGMFGLGTDGAMAYDWANQYMQAIGIMSTGTCPNSGLLGPGLVAFGTDTNSLVKTPRPTMVELDPNVAPRFVDVFNHNLDIPGLPPLGPSLKAPPNVAWDYNRDGVAHYGMLADFVRDVRGSPHGHDLVDNHLMRSADYFWHMWQKVERVSPQVPPMAR